MAYREEWVVCIEGSNEFLFLVVEGGEAGRGQRWATDNDNRATRFMSREEAEAVAGQEAEPFAPFKVRARRLSDVYRPGY